MARNRPVAICAIRQIPRRDPKFHHDERLAGAGRSIKALLIIFRRGWVLRIAGAIVFVVEVQQQFFML